MTDESKTPDNKLAPQREGFDELMDLGTNKEDVIQVALSQYETEAYNQIDIRAKEYKEVDAQRSALNKQITELELEEREAYAKEFIPKFEKAMTEICGRPVRYHHEGAFECFQISWKEPDKKQNKPGHHVLYIPSLNVHMESKSYGLSGTLAVPVDFAYSEAVTILKAQAEELEERCKAMEEALADVRGKLANIGMLERGLRGEIAKARLESSEQGQRLLERIQSFKHPRLQLN